MRSPAHLKTLKQVSREKKTGVTSFADGESERTWGRDEITLGTKWEGEGPRREEVQVGAGEGAMRQKAAGGEVENNQAAGEKAVL